MCCFADGYYSHVEIKVEKNELLKKIMKDKIPFIYLPQVPKPTFTNLKDRDGRVGDGWTSNPR